MRELTIRRNKSFVGCLVSAKIYGEDPMSGDTMINGVRCRKLGEVKNGQQVSFLVPEEAVKIFVIADKLSKGYCSEFYQLEPGQEPVLLTGQNRFNLFSGNAFRFDNNQNPEALANRKKGSKVGIWVILAAAIIGALVGFFATSGILKGEPDPKTFTVQDMKITLTEDFQEKEQENYTNYLESKRVGVLILNETFDTFPGFEDYSIEEYGELVLEANKSDSELKTDNGLCYFEFDNTGSDGKTLFHYTAYMYKGTDSFWLVQFFTRKDDAAKYTDQITQWAQTVTFES